MKQRVSLTLDEKLIKEIDEGIDGIIVRSRSDAIEKILKEHMLQKKTAVILAGGNPERLYIKSLKEYRPLLDIGGKTLIEDSVLKCRAAGFTNIVIVGFPALIAKLYETLGNGERYGIKLTYVEEKKELGTAKTLELAKDYLKTDFLFLPCDFYFDFDLRKLWNYHKIHRGDVTIGVHTRTNYQWNKGIVELDGFNIVSYEENPKSPSTSMVGVFLGFMKPDVFNLIPPGNVKWNLQENIFPKLAKSNKLIGYPIAGYWVNVHTREDLEKIKQLTVANK